MKRYFLTGCTGWLGSAIVAELLAREDTEHICLLTRDVEASALRFRDGRIRLWQGDITSCAFPPSEFTHIIHGANGSHFTDPTRCYYDIVDGTRRILEWADTREAAILLLSSGAVHRDTPYGNGKRMAELLMRCNSIAGKIARLYTLAGDYTPTTYALGGFVQQALIQRRVRVTGGMYVLRSYLHVDDAARWLLAILEHGVGLRPYEVGGNDVWSMYELGKAVAEALDVPFEHDGNQGPYDAYLPDISETRKLGVEQTISLQQTLERIRGKTSLHHPDLEPAAAP